MSIRRQLYKEADFTSDDNEQKADFLKTNRRVLFLLSTAAIIIVTITLLSWQTWRSYKHLRRTEIQLMQINSIENSVMYRNEMLTISAMMTAVTINSEWENRYRDFGPRAEAAIKDIRDVFGSNTTDAENAEEGLRVFVDDKLDIMENEALELVSRRKYKDAAALLQSPEYEEQKQAYDSGMKEFISNARSVLTERRDSHHQKALGTFTAANIILLVIGITWLVLYKKDEAVFTGDTIITALTGKPRGPVKIFTLDMDKAWKSVNMISKLNFNVLLPGHGKPVKKDASSKVKQLQR